jgi:hypothetical protein
MNTHWYAKHGVAQVEEVVEEHAEGEYKCCGKSFRGYTAYTQHWAAAHGFQCYSCARSFMSAQERDEHHLGCFVPVHRPAVPYRPAPAVVAPAPAPAPADDDAVLAMREVSLDERLAVAKQAAEQRGDVVDLTLEEARPGEPGYRQRQRDFFASAWRRWTDADPSRRIRPRGRRWFSACGLRWTDDKRLQQAIDAEGAEAAAFFAEHDEALLIADAEQAEQAERARVVAELAAQEARTMMVLQRKSWDADVMEYLQLNDDAAQIAARVQTRHDELAAADLAVSEAQSDILARLDGEEYEQALRIACEHDAQHEILAECDRQTARSFPEPEDIEDELSVFLWENDAAWDISFEEMSCAHSTLVTRNYVHAPRYRSDRLRCDAYGSWY